VERRENIGRRFCVNAGIFIACQAAIADKPAPTAFGVDCIHNPVGAGLPALNDDAISNQNSRVLDNVTCRESPIDTNNRLAAEV